MIETLTSSPFSLVLCEVRDCSKCRLSWYTGTGSQFKHTTNVSLYYQKDNITHGGGANFNGRVAECESVDSLTITGTQTLSCALGLQESMKGYAYVNSTFKLLT